MLTNARMRKLLLIDNLLHSRVSAYPLTLEKVKLKVYFLDEILYNIDVINKNKK